MQLKDMTVQGPYNGQQGIEYAEDQSEPQSCSRGTKSGKDEYPNQTPGNMQDSVCDVRKENPGQQWWGDSLKPTGKSQRKRTASLQEQSNHENPEINCQDTIHAC